MTDIKRPGSLDTDQPENVEIKTKEIPFRRVIPEDLPLEFSDQMVIRQRDDGLFILYFLQTRAPLALTKGEVDAVTSVDAVCVSQVLITADQLKKNIDAMDANLKTFIDKSMTMIGRNKNMDKR